MCGTLSLLIYNVFIEVSLQSEQPFIKKNLPEYKRYSNIYAHYKSLSNHLRIKFWNAYHLAHFVTTPPLEVCFCDFFRIGPGQWRWKALAKLGCPSAFSEDAPL